MSNAHEFQDGSEREIFWEASFSFFFLSPLFAMLTPPTCYWLVVLGTQTLNGIWIGYLINIFWSFYWVTFHPFPQSHAFFLS